MECACLKEGDAPKIEAVRHVGPQGLALQMAERPVNGPMIV